MKLMRRRARKYLFQFGLYRYRCVNVTRKVSDHLDWFWLKSLGLCPVHGHDPGAKSLEMKLVLTAAISG